MATNFLKQWFTHTTTPFIANAPMFGFADVNLATAVTEAGGFGMILMFIEDKHQLHLYMNRADHV
jgi:NAD(P)H-dependent flavin oxidoreductase YrpB (nitropropane dioxygenase family)